MKKQTSVPSDDAHRVARKLKEAAEGERVLSAETSHGAGTIVLGLLAERDGVAEERSTGGKHRGAQISAESAARKAEVLAKYEELGMKQPNLTRSQKSGILGKTFDARYVREVLADKYGPARQSKKSGE